MGKRRTDAGQLELAGIAVVFPPVKLPQPDGSILIRPGKPVVLSDEIGVREAAKILGLSTRRVQDMCDCGEFVEGVDWTKPGTGRNAKYLIRREAVIRRKGWKTASAE